MAIQKVETNYEAMVCMLNTNKTNNEILDVLKLEKDYIIDSYKNKNSSTSLIAKYLQSVYQSQFTPTKNNKKPMVTLVHIKNFLVENGVKIRTTRKRKTTKK